MGLFSEGSWIQIILFFSGHQFICLASVDYMWRCWVEGRGAEAIPCCLIASSVRSDSGISSQFQFKALSAAGKTIHAFIKKRKASRNFRISSSKIQRSLMPAPFTHASSGVFSPLLQNLRVPFSSYSCTIILSSHPDLLSRRFVCKKFKSIFKGKHVKIT